MGRSWETIEKKNLNHNNLDQEAIDFINTIKSTSMSKKATKYLYYGHFIMKYKAKNR